MTFLRHLKDLGSIRDTCNVFGDNPTLAIPSFVKFVPPTKEKVASNELEPRGKRIRYKMIRKRFDLFC